jgi:DNA-binding Lrp family transcriptional regulator
MMIDERLEGRAASELNPESWWDAIDGEILDRLREHGSASVRELCEETGLSEGAATAFLSMLAREGRVRIVQFGIAA